MNVKVFLKNWEVLHELSIRDTKRYFSFNKSKQIHLTDSKHGNLVLVTHDKLVLHLIGEELVQRVWLQQERCRVVEQKQKVHGLNFIKFQCRLI